MTDKVSSKVVEKEECSNCKYLNTATCRRYPPVTGPSAIVGIANYPLVELTYWCGEYIKKK